MRTPVIFIVPFVMVCLMLGGPAHAQVATNPVANPKAEAQWNRFLANHSNVQAGMVNDPNYVAKHPGMGKWLHDHPEVTAYARQQGQIGGWDRQNRWHDADWWHHNDPDWVYQHHPEWVSNHPRWGNDGDYDDEHHWRNRDWWVEHHREWANEHHPSWYEENGDHRHDYGDGDHDHEYRHNEGHGHDHGDKGHGHGHRDNG